jgi:hypothetical protein
MLDVSGVNVNRTSFGDVPWVDLSGGDISTVEVTPAVSEDERAPPKKRRM